MAKSVLIVDDEVLIRSLLEQTLEDIQDDHDVIIHTANDGEAGLSAAKNFKPELIFLDIMMPKMNGLDVCAAIRQDDLLNDTKIVLLTARGQESDRQEGLNRGANEYVTKPFDPDHIIALTENYLNL